MWVSFMACENEHVKFQAKCLAPACHSIGSDMPLNQRRNCGYPVVIAIMTTWRSAEQCDKSELEP